MKLGVMQPYFFPYIGYFQLIHAVDAFVVYDDVNYIKGGWINRNYILSRGKKMRLTLELMGASQNILINQIQIGNNQPKLMKSIGQSYSQAPMYSEVIALIEQIMSDEEKNLAKFLNKSLRTLCTYLKVERDWYLSSELEKDVSLRGQQKILAICKELGAVQYINVPGGRELYDHSSFEKRDIRLSFIEPAIAAYQQNCNEFLPYLSIIDVMMFNSQQQCQQMLQEYEIV